MGSLGTPCGKIRYKGQVPGCNSHCTYSKDGSGEGAEETEDAASTMMGEEEAQADVEEDQREGELGDDAAPTPEEEEAVEELEEADEELDDACQDPYLPRPPDETEEEHPPEEEEEGLDLGEVQIDPEADAYENPWEPYF